MMRDTMKSYQQRCWALLAAAMVAGCSSPQMNRINSNRDIYETWPLETKQAVLDGKVEPGMTPEMVKVAWGKPTEVITRAGAPNSGDDEIWIYRTGGGEDPSMMYPGAGYPGGYPNSGVMNSGTGITIGTGRGGTVITPSTTIGIGGGTAGIGLGGSGIGMGNAGMGSPYPYPSVQRPVEEREVVFRDGVVYRADEPPK